MKAVTANIFVLLLLAACQCPAAESPTNVWGPETNKVKMCIMVKDLTYRLSADDITDVSHFVGRLSHQSDPISLFLWNSFSQEDQAVLNDFDALAPNPNHVKDIIAKDLNKIIGGTNIFSWERFKGVVMRPETDSYATYYVLPGTRSPQPYLNRMLLEDAFPSELSRVPKGGDPRIKMGTTVVLTIVFTNMSTNETYFLPTDRGIENDPRYTFEVICPSGDIIAPHGDPMRSRAESKKRLDPDKIRQLAFTFDLGSICKFDEIGIYTIIAKRVVDWPSGPKQYFIVQNEATPLTLVQEASFTVVSNPLTITIIPDK